LSFASFALGPVIQTLITLVQSLYRIIIDQGKLRSGATGVWIKRRTTWFVYGCSELQISVSDRAKSSTVVAY